MPRFDPTKLDDMDTTEIAETYKKAGAIVSCAWLVCSARRKSDGKYRTHLAFFDSEKKEFAHVFELDSSPEVTALCARLQRSKIFCEKMNG